MGLLSIFCGTIFSILALIFGFLGKAKSDNEGAPQRGMAMAGIIIGGITLAISVLLFIIRMAAGY
jgi:uncharacterized membrane protein